MYYQHFGYWCSQGYDPSSTHCRKVPGISTVPKKKASYIHCPCNLQLKPDWYPAAHRTMTCDGSKHHWESNDACVAGFIVSRGIFDCQECQSLSWSCGWNTPRFQDVCWWLPANAPSCHCCQHSETMSALCWSFEWCRTGACVLVSLWEVKVVTDDVCAFIFEYNGSIFGHWHQLGILNGWGQFDEHFFSAANYEFDAGWSLPSRCHSNISSLTSLGSLTKSLAMVLLDHRPRRTNSWCLI